MAATPGSVDLPLCANGSFASLAWQGGDTGGPTALLATSAAALITAPPPSGNGSAPTPSGQAYTVAWTSNGLSMVASRTRTDNNSTLSLTLLLPPGSPGRNVTLPDATGNGTARGVLLPDATGVATLAISPAPVAVATALGGGTDHSQYMPVPLQAPADGATAWVGGPSSTAMLQAWAALFAEEGGSSPWPVAPVYAGLALDVRPPPRGNASAGAGETGVCTGAGTSGPVGSLRLGGLHGGYGPGGIPITWSEAAGGGSPLSTVGIAPSFSSAPSTFLMYRPSLCGVSLAPALLGGATGHVTAEVDTASVCTVLPAPLFDAAVLWLPLVNCPPPAGGATQQTAQGPRSCPPGDGYCGYSALDALVCDVLPAASASVMSGSTGLPSLSFWLREPRAAGPPGSAPPSGQLHLPLADLLVPRGSVRGPSGLADHIPGLAPGEWPTHSLCLVRAPGSEDGGSGPILPPSSRVRLGTLALSSLYVAWELQPPSGRMPSSWSDLTAAPFATRRMGMAVKPGPRGAMGLDSALGPVPGFSVYATCTQPVASNCIGAQAYSALANSCIAPTCSAYDLQEYDAATGLCRMHVGTIFVAMLLLAVGAATSVYLYVLSWLVAAKTVAGVREREVAPRGPARPLLARGPARYQPAPASGSSRSLGGGVQGREFVPCCGGGTVSTTPTHGREPFAYLTERAVITATGVLRRRHLRATEGAGEGEGEEEEDAPPPPGGFTAWVEERHPALARVASYVALQGGGGLKPSLAPPISVRGP
jgi:hypothetical protein